MRKKKATIVQVKLSLIEGRDDDLLQFFESIPSYKRAQSVMSAMRSGNIQGQQVEEENLDDLIGDLFF